MNLQAIIYRITTQLNMSNDYFKAQGWFKDYARNSQDSRGMFQRLVKEDEEAFRLASAETDKIKNMMNKKYGPGTMKYGSEIPQPSQRPDVIEIDALNAFMRRNPAAEGGRQGFDNGLGVKKMNRDESYRKVVKDFVATSGPGTGSIFDDPAAIDIVKANLNKIKKQKNNKAFFEWSENSDWYKALQKELNPNTKKGTNREFTNKLINKVVDEFFPGAYHGKNAIKDFRNDTVVKSFIQHLKSVGEFDGQEKFDKVLEQFKNPPKKGTPNNYESINKSWKAWRAGEFEVDGVDRAQLKKELKARGINYDETIGKWTASGAQLRGKDKIKELKTLNKLNRFTNKSAEEIRALFLKEHPNANFYLRVNELTQLKRNGVYVSGANTELPVTGIEKGDRAGWLKKAYGKQFAGNYSKIINAADKLNDPNYMGGKFYDPKKAKRLYNAADKFFGPTGIIRKSAVGEAEHALARSFDFLNPDRQLAINSIVDGDLNQFKKNLFDIPVKQYFDEYNKEGTTDARKKELKNLIENRKKTMNALTGGQTKGIVAGDIVSFEYGDKIKPTSSVKAIDVLFDEGKFDIDEYIAKGNAYGEALKKTGLKIDKSGSIIGEDKLTEIESYITDRTGKVKQPMLSSGFSGAFEMLSDDLKPVLNNPKFKAFAKTVVNTPGKLFGIGDVVLGYLDYKNNIGQGMSEERAKKLAYQAMSIGMWRGGDRQYIKELKDTYLKQGGDESVFDQVINLNKQNADLMQTVENTKKNYKKNVENEKTFGNIIGDVGLKYQVDLPTASEQLKLDLNSIKNKAEDMDKNFTTFKETYTGEDLTKPSKDIKSAAFENLTKERLKAFDTKSLQSDTEVGPVWNSLRTNLLNTQSIPRTLTTAVDFINPFTPLPKLDDLRSDRARYEAQLKEMKEKYPREFYLENLRRGMDRDNPITVDAAANLMSKPELGFSEGGITGLKSKYEYKK
jgi:hypothetical protein